MRTPVLDDVRAAIHARGWTIAHAARLIGCSPRYLQRVIRGREPLSVPIAHELAGLLDLDPEALLDREEALS